MSSDLFSPARIRAQIAEILGEQPDDLGSDESLLDLGLDSIRLMTLVDRWARDGAEVSFEELAQNPTIAAWSALLTERVTTVNGATR